MAEIQLNPQQERALARLKCAHCQSLINCDALAKAVLAELQSRYRIDYRRGAVAQSDGAELVGAVREGIDRFLSD